MTGALRTPQNASFERWLSPPLVALLLSATGGILEAAHAYIGYQLAGQPAVGFTLRGQPLTFLDIMARTLPSWLVLGALAGVAMRLAEHRPLFATDWKRSLVFHLPLGLLFSAMFLIAAALFRHYLFVGRELNVGFSATLLRYYTVYFNTHFLWYWGIVGVYSGFLHYRELRARDVRTEKLQRQLTEARLQMLQQQIHPHFLFNTLNAVSGLALDGNVSGTVRTLTLLGELLRATLRRTDQVVTIAREIELLQLYLDIQRIRLEERLDVRMLIDTDVMDAGIPTFLLQPLVENAIRHGISRESKNGWIEIVATRRGERVMVSITDSGAGIGSDPIEAGVGISNCVARLDELYGDDYGFDIRNLPGAGAQVQIDWPLRALPPDVESPPRHAAMEQLPFPRSGGDTVRAASPSIRGKHG